MSAVSNDKWLEAVAATVASYHRMIVGAVSQLSDAELHQRPSPGVNSVAVILRHLSGNLLSRWTDFLTTDGEKPDRDRDREFTDWEGDRDSLLAYFDSGWAALTKAIGQIDAANMDQPVFIRGERHSIADALLRSLTHLSYHVGQIALIARLVHQGEWRWLTIPPGQSTQHNLQTWGTAASRSVFGEGTVSTIDQPEITRWAALDETPSPSAFIEYLDAVSSLTAIQRIKQQTFDRLQAGAGDHLLDVGCGAGDDVRALAQRVGKTGRVVGFEVSATMIEEARRRSSGLNLPIEFCLGDADRLDFPNETFTGCRIDRVLVHLDDPLRTLSEMVRVLRPGGRLVAFDFDWETLIVDAPDRALTRRLLNFFCDQGPSRWIGRQLRGLCSSLALTEIDVAAETLEFVDYTQANRVLMFERTAKQAVAAGLATVAEAESWLHNLEQSHAEGRFFAALTGFCVSGRKPGASAEPGGTEERS